MSDKEFSKELVKPIESRESVVNIQQETSKKKRTMIYEEHSPETVNRCVEMLYKRAPEGLRRRIFYMLTNS